MAKHWITEQTRKKVALLRKRLVLISERMRLKIQAHEIISQNELLHLNAGVLRLIPHAYNTKATVSGERFCIVKVIYTYDALT